jgi:ABC-type lipoprotein release transport system permease subunit
MAWRNLWRNRRRTILTLISIAFGGFLAVLMTALQDRSFSDFIDTAARLGSGHVTVQHDEYLKTPTLDRTVPNSQSVRQMALQDPLVERAVTRIAGQAMLSTARDSHGAFFMAIDVAQEDEETFTLWEGLVEGERFAGTKGRAIVLGSRLAEKLDVKMGGKIVYTMTDKEGEIVAGMARLSGIIHTNVPTLDSGLCLLPIDQVRELLGYEPEESTNVALFIADSRDSAEVAGRLAENLDPGVAALTWDEAQPQIASFVSMKIGGGRVMELIITILVAAGIFNTLFVSVMERLREFGIMMAIGFSPRRLFGLVMWESLWMGLVGLVSCAVITAWPYYYLVKNGINMTQMYGDQTPDIGGVGFDPIMRVGIYPENLAVIMVAIVFATLLAGLYPAWRAGRVVPVETIKLV